MRLIDADNLLDLYTFGDEVINETFVIPLPVVCQNIMDMPTVDAVSRAVYDQTAWERDVAVLQLKDIGKGLGEKMDDVAHVAQGRWTAEGKSCFGNDLIRCSSCGRLLREGKDIRYIRNYCPNCGARMDGGAG